MEALNRGEWCYVGIYAVAVIQTMPDGCLQTIRTAGRWGIESDSGEDYLRTVAQGELNLLDEELGAWGISPKDTQGCSIETGRVSYGIK
jgi:hypothetical protein